MWIRLVTTVCACLVLVALGCTGKPLAKGSSKLQILTDATQRQHEVLLGKRFMIALRGNRTTGYTWTIVDPPDEKVVKFIAAQYRPDAPEDGRVGAGGTELFTFEAMGEGGASIKFAYQRPWEKVEPAETKTFRVVVR